MTEPVKRWNAPRGTTISASDNGEYVLATDYERLEQECERVRTSLKDADAGMMLFLEQRDTALQLLACCQERLDPHRDAVLWGEVCEAFKAKP